MTTQNNGAAPAAQSREDAKALAAQERAGNLGLALSSKAMRDQLAKILPTHLNAERFLRIAISASTKNPALKTCTQESLTTCLIQLTEMGLEPDGRRAHLIPYGRECTLIVDYKGLKELVRRSGEIARMHDDVVYEKEVEEGRFIYEEGSEAQLIHKPILVGDRGKVVGAYSYIKMRNGEESTVWMRIEEIEELRGYSKNTKPDGPWQKRWNEMAKKTVFRNHSKVLTLSSELHHAVETDDKYLYDFSIGSEGGQSGEPPAGRQKLRTAQQVQPTVDIPDESGHTYDGTIDTSELTESEKQEILELERREAAAEAA